VSAGRLLPSRWRPVDRLIVVHGLSSFCLGLAFPYTAIYLTHRQGLGTAAVALFYACSGTANLIAALVLSTGAVRVPQVRLGVLGTLLWCVGYLAVPLAGVPAAVALAGAAVGAGQGCFLAAVVPIVNGLTDPAERRAVFARRYAVLNGTLAAGSLVAGALTLVLPRSVIAWFFVANGVGMLPVAAVILASARHLRPAPSAVRDASGDGPGTGRGLPTRALWLLVLPPAAFQFAAYLLGFSQFEATAPLVSESLMDLGLSAVPLLLLVNVAVISALQGWVTRRLEGRPETVGLRLALLAWVAGFAVAGALAAAPHGVRLGGMLGYAVLFGLGECAYSCSFHPWLIALVPEEELTRATALVNSMMGIGNLAGPSLGVALAATGSATAVWLGLGGLTAALLAASALDRSRRGSPGRHPAVVP